MLMNCLHGSGVFIWCVQPLDSGGLLHSSSIQFRWVISWEFFGNSMQLQRHDSVHLSSSYTDNSFSTCSLLYVLMAGYYILLLWFLLSFFSSPILSSRRVISYFHTWCALSANLECRSELCCTRLAENTGTQKFAKKSPSVHHHTICLQLRHVLTIGKNFKQ